MCNRKFRGHTGCSHRDEQCREGRNYSDTGEMQEPTEEHEASNGWTDHLIRNVTSVWKQEPRIHKFEVDDSQRDGAAAVYGRGSGIRGTALRGKKKCT